MTRQSGVLCGVEWFNRTFEELDPDVEIFWHHEDGDDDRRRHFAVRDRGQGARAAHRRAHGAELRAAALRRGHQDAPVRRRRSRARARASSTRARRCRACAWRRNTRCARAAARTTASASTTASSSRKTTSRGRRRAQRGARALRDSAPEGTMLQVEVETLDQLREALDAGARAASCSTTSTSRRCARRCASTGDRAELEASGGVTLRDRARHRRDRRAPHLGRLAHQGREGARPVHAFPPSLTRRNPECASSPRPPRLAWLAAGCTACATRPRRTTRGRG